MCIVDEDSKYPMPGDTVCFYRQKKNPNSHLIVMVQDEEDEDREE